METKELEDLLKKANDNFNAQKEANEALTTQFKALETNYNEITAQVKELTDAGDSENLIKAKAQIDELVQEMSDLRSKYKAPAVAITNADQKEAMREIAMKAFGGVIKKNKQIKGDVFDSIKEEIDLQLKTLNITTAAEGGLAIMSVLAMDVMHYARERSPAMELIGHKSSMTRDYSQLLYVTYPGVDEGIEAVAGTVPAETSTQEYVEVKASEFKITAQPRLTNEALLGTDINIYADLLFLLGQQISRKIASQIWFGDGTGKNARGILSSNRIDITDTTGESFLPTLTPDGTGARSPDFYPVFPTGVDGSMGADDVAIVDYVIDMTNMLPTHYLANAVWVMNRKTKGVFEKVRDGDQRPIFVKDYIPGLPGKQLMLNGHRVVIDDTLPDIASDSTFAIFGDLSQAFAINSGDIDQMLLDPYTKKGCLIVYTEKEYFEMVQLSDAIIVAAATTNSGA